MLTRLARDESWKDEAACRDMGPAFFFAGRGETETTEQAKAICVQCPVRERCLAYAMTPPFEREGVWGGASERQRRRMRIDRRRVATNVTEEAS